MPKLSEELVTGNLSPWRDLMYNFLTKEEKETLQMAYDLEQKRLHEVAMANKKALKQAELDKEITRVNASLESPKLVFTIADLSEDPGKFETELVDFLRRHTGDEISLVGSSKISTSPNSPFVGLGQQPNSKMNFSAKVKWSMASFEVISANGKHTVVVSVPIE